MKDPELLVSEGATDFERRWLSAARAEDAPPEVVSRLEQALGLGTAAPTAPVAPAVVSAPAVATAAATSGLWALRIAGLSAVGVAGAVGVALLLSRTPTPPAEQPRAAVSAPVENAPAAVTSPVAPAVAPNPATSTGTLPDEIAMIDGARVALAAGAPERALSLLERYRQNHPHGMLLPEALAMRIEAIDRSGEHTRAQELARAFLRDYPQSPLAQRVAQLMVSASAR